MKGAVRQLTGNNGQQAIELIFDSASALVYLQGAHIVSWKPDGVTEMLWVSETSSYAPGKAIRGGIPICWPWFGSYWGDQPDRAQHGFARIADFELVDFEATDIFSRVRLRMISDAPYPEWKNRLELEVEIVLSDGLGVELITTNISDEMVEVGAALHTYFRVADVNRVQIPELRGLRYRDKVRNFDTFVQESDFTVSEETDRVFLDPPAKVHLMAPETGQNLKIESWGNTDLVVWNPWAWSAKNMADFDDLGYLNMICIEPANALDNRQKIKPEQRFRLGKTILMA